MGVSDSVLSATTIVGARGRARRGPAGVIARGSRPTSTRSQERLCGPLRCRNRRRSPSTPKQGRARRSGRRVRFLRSILGTKKKNHDDVALRVPRRRRVTDHHRRRRNRTRRAPCPDGEGQCTHLHHGAAHSPPPSGHTGTDLAEAFVVADSGEPTEDHHNLRCAPGPHRTDAHDVAEDPRRGRRRRRLGTAVGDPEQFPAGPRSGTCKCVSTISGPNGNPDRHDQPTPPPAAPPGRRPGTNRQQHSRGPRRQHRTRAPATRPRRRRRRRPEPTASGSEHRQRDTTAAATRRDCNRVHPAEGLSRRRRPQTRTPHRDKRHTRRRGPGRTRGNKARGRRRGQGNNAKRQRPGGRARHTARPANTLADEGHGHDRDVVDRVPDAVGTSQTTAAHPPGSRSWEVRVPKITGPG